MTNNKQHTAVEWFFFECGKYGDTAQIPDSVIDEAKEMEKQQHATTWDKSMDNLDARGGNIVRAWGDFDEYYNQTYGGGEQ
jgi:hypothetical protein